MSQRERRKRRGSKTEREEDGGECLLPLGGCSSGHGQERLIPVSKRGLLELAAGTVEIHW